MSDNTERLSPLGAGFLRLWTEKQIREGRKITASTLAREASVEGGPVQYGAPWAVVLQTDGYSAKELARMLAYLGTVDLEKVEEIGRMPDCSRSGKLGPLPATRAGDQPPRAEP